jgi:hypothetical protein
MNRIHIIVQRFPYPPRRGDQLAVSKLISAACAENMEVMVWAPSREVRKWNGTPSNVVFKRLWFNPFRMLWNFIKHPMDPIQVKLFSGYHLTASFSNEIVYVHSIRMSRVVSSKKFFEINLGAQINHAVEFLELCRESKSNFKRIVYWLETKLLDRWYRQNLYRFRSVFSVSENEFINYDLKNILVYSHGANLPLLEGNKSKSPGNKYTIGFWGNMNFAPNHFAAERFASVSQRFVDEFRFVIFGLGSDGFRNNQGFRHVEVLGEVESIEEEIDRIDVLLNLVDSGAGFQNKTLEAWCRGVVVIGFENAFRGLDGSEHLQYIVQNLDELAAHLAAINIYSAPQNTKNFKDWVGKNRDPNRLNFEKLNSMREKK